MKTRREFLNQSVTLAAGTLLLPALARASASQPNVSFPTNPRDRIAVASYPFRDFISPGDYATAALKSTPKMEIAEFAAHISERFHVNKIEPWSAHFRSLEPKYLADFRSALDRAKASVVNIAVDGKPSFYAADPTERAQAVAVNKQWIDAATTLGSPSIRTHIASADKQAPDLERCADSLRRIAD